MMSKLYSSPAEAVAGVLSDGMTLAVGGFGLSGNPTDVIEAVRDSGVKELTVVSNNMGIDGHGLGLLIEAGQVRKVIASYVGENKRFAEQYISGDLDVEFAPQGTLAAGKEHAEFDGRTYILERGIVADVALVHAFRGDTEGNLIYRRTARNFNPLVATAGRLTIAEVEQLVDPGELDPDEIVTPGIFVQRLVVSSDRLKVIEQRTVRRREEPAS